MRSRQLDSEMEEESRLPIALKTEGYLKAGVPPNDARRGVRLAFGAVKSLIEECPDRRGLLWIAIPCHNIGHGARRLRKHPRFTVIAVLTLALGFGANTAISSLVNAVLLRPPTDPEPRQLVQLRADLASESSTLVDSATSIEVKVRSQSLAGIAAYTGGELTFTGAGSAERVAALALTADFFSLLGAQPALGRCFSREEETPNGPKSVVLGNGLWKSRLGGDAQLLGRTITLDDHSYTVVGILPARFHFPEPCQV